jgi:hypothetical protein
MAKSPSPMQEMQVSPCKLHSGKKVTPCCKYVLTNQGVIMKFTSLLLLLSIALFSKASFSQDHKYHAKHNMILFGESDSFYASHIVYKVPHNYQVILKINFDSNSKEIINKEMTLNPKDQFIFLLNHMNISQINEMPLLSGQIFRRAQDGSKKMILPFIELSPDDYSNIYFDELPLSLEAQNLNFDKRTSCNKVGVSSVVKCCNEKKLCWIDNGKEI